MTLRRGDVVIVNFTPTNPRAQIRPALVIQNDRDNARMANTIVAQLTTNIRRAGADTQLLIDLQHPDWNSSGLLRPSVVNCSNLATISQQDVTKVIGSISVPTMQQVDHCLKTAIGIL